MKQKSLLLNLTGEMPLFKIIDFLLDNKGMDFSKSDISKGAGISRASLFNYWSQIESHGIVKVTRSFGKTKLYTLNREFGELKTDTKHRFNHIEHKLNMFEAEFIKIHRLLEAINNKLDA